MNIGIDATCWWNNRGFGRFTRELLQALFELDCSHQFFLFVDQPLDELQQFYTEIGADVFDVLTLEGSVAARNHIGGTAPDQVRAAAARARAALALRQNG